MKANELRIGNLLKRGGVIVTIDARTIFDFSTLDYQYEPIPLTPAWLERFGWIWNAECKSYEKYPNGDARMNLALRMGGSYTMFNYVLKATIADRIYYVHQLQNLYFALKGEELTTANHQQSPMPRQ